MKKLLYSMEKLRYFLHFFPCFPRLNRKMRFSRSDLENRDFRFKGGQSEKIEVNEKVALFNGETFSFSYFFHFFQRLNRKTRFLRSEILKNLNICPSKDRHLTCYRFYDFLQYGLMDLVKSFFKWCMIYNFNRKSQKAPMSCHFLPEIMIYGQKQKI